jgi:ribosomal 30S subunit maturation factor RimM
VITGTGNDLIVLRRDGKSDSYIPFVREFVKKVELKERRVTVSLIPGLIE